jgi:hypothetical protein
MLLVVCAAACQSSARPVSGGSTTTLPQNGDQAATYQGLSVRLQLSAPAVDSFGTYVDSDFLIDNGTSQPIALQGCAFGSFTFGLLPAAHPDGPLTGTVEASCGLGATTYAPGASDRFHAARFPIRSRKIRVPAGRYIAVVRFPDGTKVQQAVTIPA